MDITLHVPAIHCTGCVNTVKTALRPVTGVEVVDADADAKLVTLRITDRDAERRALAALDVVGYGPKAIGDTFDERGRSASERRAEGRGDVAYDLAILGGGAAAFAAEIRARDLGASVFMIEQGEIGGACVNIGCVPSKALLRASELYYAAGHHAFAGIQTRALGVDLRALVEQKRQLVTQMRQAKYSDLVPAYGWEYRRGTARFLDAETIAVDGVLGNARAYLIATGASPWLPPIPGLAEAEPLTSTTALELDRLPQRLLVIGANAVGLELGQYFHQLGSRVTFLEALPRLAPFEEPEISAALFATFENHGVDAELGVRIQRVERDGTTRRVFFTDADGQARSMEAEAVLVATGRRPNTANLALDRAGVAVDAKGAILTDAGLRTSTPRVWAAGDCTQAPQFVYVSAYEGALAVDNILNSADRTVDFSALPKVTFTSPQIASVGLGDEAAQAAGYDAHSVLLPLESVPRAIVNRDTWGVIKLVAEKETGRLLGVHILAENAGEMIQTGVLAVKFRLTIRYLQETFFPYLTQVEGIKLAAQAFDRDPALLSCCAG